jgi:AbrB family looped-hinge helix DNA binding protein
MASVRVREKGQMTLPNTLRREMGWSSGNLVSAVKVGDSILLVPKPVLGDALARKATRAMKTRKITLQDLLGELKKIRKDYKRPHASQR